MAKRVIVKKGDIFEVPLENGKKGYFQHTMLDLTQLNSEVIRIFKSKYNNDETPDIEVICNDEIEYNVHCSIKAGIKRGLWDKIGNIEIEDNSEIPFFRDNNDYGDSNPEVSQNWHAWQSGGEFFEVGKLNDKTRKYNIGLVINPFGIIELMKGNKYPPNYPD